MLAAFLGWFWGKEDERRVNRDTGNTYPFGSSLELRGFLGLLLFGLPTAGGSLLASQLKARKMSGKEKIHFLRQSHRLTLILTMIPVLVFLVVYQLSRPLEYYSGAIEYGVYSGSCGEKP